MKKILFLISLFVCGAGYSQSVKINALPTATSATTSDLVIIDQTDSTRHITTANLFTTIDNLKADSIQVDTIHVNGYGLIDKVTISDGAISATDITIGAGTTLNVSSGTLTVADNQISGDKVEGGTIAAITITSLTSDNIVADSIQVDSIHVNGYALIDNATISSGSVTVTSVSSGTVTATGTITGLTMVTLDTAATVILAASDCDNAVRFNNDADAVDYTLPACAAGLVVMFYDIAGGVITIDAVDGTDTIYLNGVSVGAGDAIDSPGAAGDFICLMGIDATRWVTIGRSGVWVDGGAD